MEATSKKIIILKGNKIYDLLIHLGIVVSLGITLLFGFFTNFLPYFTDHGETVTVPNLVGMSVQEIDEFMRSKGLTYIIKDSTYSRKYKPFTVLSQSPEPGAKVKQSRKITIVISPKNPPMRKMPELTNLVFESAERIIKNMDLEIGRIKYVPDVSDQVLMITYNGKKIKAGDPILAGSKVDLVVGDGLGEKEFPVPNLVGLPLHEAELILKGMDLVVNIVAYDNNSNQEIGTVIKQKPDVRAGKVRKGTIAFSDGDDRPRNMVRAGQTIDIWVSGNAAPDPESKEDENQDDSEDYDDYSIRNAKDIEAIEKKRKKEKEIKEGKKTTEEEEEE
ncbi:MAG: PASTA domain-containing protein [Cytophagales bacterium]|nr:MAG: PASTA domain-containing protein [Cytophagales bacterium]